MPIDLDPRFTFDTFVVGPANRLAVAAARRIAESPGTTYNPLFIYGGSGLGKTHLLTAVGHEAARLHATGVVFQTVEQLMDEMSRAVEAGEPDAFRGRLQRGDVVLLDDIQFLTGRRQVQEELLRSWDEHIAGGGQIVLSSDRPPQDLDDLDRRLVTRFSGGLIVDMGPPDYETRVAIARRKADERGETLAPDVFPALARVAFSNVRELQGALNRLIAIQELEGRSVRADEVSGLLGAAAKRGEDQRGAATVPVQAPDDGTGTQANRRIADAILRWEGQGYRTRRLDGALADSLSLPAVDRLIRSFEAEASRLRTIEAEIRRLDPYAYELRAAPLRDPDRLAEAEALLVTVRDRRRPPPAPPPGGGLDSLPGDSLALRAARAVAARPGSTYNPLYVLGPPGSGKTALLAALGNEIHRTHGSVVAFTDGATFEADLIEALGAGRVEAWRARYRQADVLLLHGVDGLAGMEGAHEELFHLFEDLHRRGCQLVFAAAVPPHDLPVPDRLRSRLESGLVVEIDGVGRVEPSAGALSAAAPADASLTEAGGRAGGEADDVLSPEKVLWEWPYLEDWTEELAD